jgi:hypothetical protein
MEDDLIDNHERCRNCKRYIWECVPPPDIDSFFCQNYVKMLYAQKREYNPSKRRNTNE